MIHFFFKNLLGTLLLALVGAISIFIGVVGFFNEMKREEETAPTPLAVAEFEKTGKVPPQRWLELTDGQLVWDQKSQIVVSREDRNGKKVGNETVSTVFVPLASKKRIDAWQRFPNDPFPLHEVRIYVRYSPSDWDKQVLKQEGNLDARAKLSGMVATLDQEEKLVREGLYQKEDRIDPKKILIVRYGQTAPTLGIMIVVVLFFVGVGLLFMIPFILRLVRGGGAKEASRYAEH